MCALKVKKVVVAAIGPVVGLCFCAYGDGVFVWQKGVDLYGPSQKAIILYDEGIEDLILQVKYKGEASDFAWIVPVPSKPEVKAVDGDIFAEVSEYTQLREYGRHLGTGKGRMGGMEEKVEVIERKKVSVYDVAVLNAKDAAALVKWLNQNGFSFPDRGGQILEEYIEKKWTFAALRIHPDEEKLWVEKSLNEGTLVPLKFTFASKEIVYPLKISSLNKGETEVLVYAFYEDAVVHPDLWAQAPSAYRFYRYSIDPNSATSSLLFEAQQEYQQVFAEYFDFEHKFYRPLGKDKLPLCREALPRLNKKEFFLSKLRNTFKTDEMEYDIVLKPVEKLSKQEKLHFVERHTRRAGSRGWNSLLIRAEDALVNCVAERMKKYKPSEQENMWFAGAFEFLAQEPSDRVFKLFEAAACHEYSCLAEQAADGLCYRANRSIGPVDTGFIPILKKLGGRAPLETCRALKTIGSNEAIEVLREYVTEQEDGRQYALEVLREVKDPNLIEVYGVAVNKGRLSDYQIYLCLRGLELIDDPIAYPIIENVLNNNEDERNRDLARKLLAKWKK
ncbi:MAG: DUF2330 domain-containing protein [Planctomycetota bacterium]|jgi:hypothetical protein